MISADNALWYSFAFLLLFTFGTSAVQVLSLWQHFVFQLPTDELMASNTPPLVRWKDEKFQDSFQRYLGLAPVSAFVLHIIPSLCWSILLLIQFSPHLRKSFKKLHRMSGYLFWVPFCISLL